VKADFRTTEVAPSQRRAQEQRSIVMNATDTERAGWRGVGRPVVVAVLGDLDLAALVEDPGVQVCAFPSEAAFLEAEPGLTADAFDAVVVAYAPWPQVDGVALARGLRRRCIGTVVVGESGHQFLLEEQLAVVPPSATAPVRRFDLQAAVAVAVQETWALAPMRDPWSGSEPERTTEDHVLEAEVLDSRPLPPPAPSVTPSRVRQDALGRASRSTMIQLFGDEDLGALEAPPLPASAPSALPSWASDGTREWSPSGSVLAELTRAYGDDVPLPGVASPSVTAVSAPPADMPSGGAAEGDQSLVLLPPPPRGQRGWVIAAAALGVLTGLLAMALWFQP